jgi:hypothetical protein
LLSSNNSLGFKASRKGQPNSVNLAALKMEEKKHLAHIFLFLTPRKREREKERERERERGKRGERWANGHPSRPTDLLAVRSL